MNAQAAFYSGSYKWSDPDGNLFTPEGVSVVCPYTVSHVSMLPIPQGSTQGQEFDINFTGMVQDASLIWIKNATGQELNMAWGGNWMPHLVDGGFLIWAAPSLRVGGQITALRFMLTQAQTSPGCIKYAVMGS